MKKRNEYIREDNFLRKLTADDTSETTKQISELFHEVEQQVETANPAFVPDIYYTLQRKGCNRKQAYTVIVIQYAKEKYLAQRENRDFDEKLYESSLRTTNRTFTDPMDVRAIPLEIEEELNAAFEDITNHEMDEDYEYCAEKLLTVWPRTKEYIIHYLYRDTKTGIEKPELCDISELSDYNLTIDSFLPDMAMILGNAGRYEEEIAYCKDILDLFSWERFDPDEYKDDIGMALKNNGNHQAAVQWYEDWLVEEPDNGNCINAYAFMLQIEGDIDGALCLVEAHLPEGEPTAWKYNNLYLRAGELYDAIGDTDKANHYRDLEKACCETDSDFPAFNGFEHFSDDEDDWKLKPVVKEKKIYPNDPCPCGSGKKYKKCCGKV